MQKIIDWVNQNNTFILVVIAAVFAFFTLVLLIFLSFKSGSAKKLKLLAKAMQYSHRPRILPKFITQDGRVKCLVFENIGSQYARNVSILINSEWLESKEKLPDFQSNNITLQQLQNKKIMMAPGETLSYGLYIIGTANIETFKNEMFKATVRYTDNTEKLRYEESFLLDLALHEDLITGTTDFTRSMTRLGEKIEKVEIALRDIDNRISEVSSASRKTYELQEKKFNYMKKTDDEPIAAPKKRKTKAKTE